MTNSKGSSVIVGNERPQDWLSAVVVVPDGSGQSEQSLQYPGHHTLGGVTSVSFQVELAFEGLVARLDELTERLQDPCSGPLCLALLRRTDELCPLGGEEALELGAGVALVGQDDQARSGSEQCGVDLEQVPGHLAFVHFGIGQGEGDREPDRGAHQVEAQSPEVAGVAGTEPVPGEPGQCTAHGGRAGTPALEPGGG